MPTRRTLIRSLATVAAGAILAPESVLADPYRLWLPRRLERPIRIRGRVAGSGRGLGGVAVSDGYNVVGTDGDGSFELVTDSDRSFVAVTTPRGWAIPRRENGTAALYRRIPPNADGELEMTFDLEPLGFDDANHTALILPDIQTETPFEMRRFHDESIPDLLGTVRGLTDTEVFGISCGDIMFDDLSMYPDYERGIAQLDVPFFQCIGNHDLDFDGPSDEASTRTFSERFGPRYYSFDRGDVHYIVLDDVLWHGAGYIGYLGFDQLHWLEADLARIAPGSPVVVATHIPVVGSRHLRQGATRPGSTVSINNRDILYRLLEPFDAHVVTGHTHENDHIYENGVHEHVSGTVCGAWWSGDICADGTPNGYSVYEVRGSEVTWRYKSVGKESAYQLRTYERGADPAAPDEVVANIWDADPGWTVVWYEGGDRRGRMARRVGQDPRSRIEHTGDELPTHRPWVDPYPTSHLYYAPVDPGHGPIRIEATDRFGRTYSAAI